MAEKSTDTTPESDAPSTAVETSSEEQAVPATSDSDTASTEAEPSEQAAATESSEPVESAHTSTEPATAAPTPTATTESGRVVYIETPPPPRDRSNRGVAVVLALVGVVAFVGLYALAAAIIIPALRPGIAGDAGFAAFVQSDVFWIPILVFLVAFVVMVLLINRGGWWIHVLASAIVAFVVYFGTIGLKLLTDLLFGDFAGGSAAAAFEIYAVNPLIVPAAILAREVSIWVGLGISARGRRVRARNAEKRAAFEQEVAERRAEHERAVAEA